MDLFNLKGGACHPASGCVTPTAVIDDSKVDHNTPGKVYLYTVTCAGCTGNNVANGQIYIKNYLN